MHPCQSFVVWVMILRPCGTKLPVSKALWWLLIPKLLVPKLRFWHWYIWSFMLESDSLSLRWFCFFLPFLFVIENSSDIVRLYFSRVRCPLLSHVSTNFTKRWSFCLFSTFLIENSRFEDLASGDFHLPSLVSRVVSLFIFWLFMFAARI